jgi:hypothetical protein
MKPVHLSLRILLIGLFSSAAGPREKRSVEVYGHEKSNKNLMREGNKSYCNGVVV